MTWLIFALIPIAFAIYEARRVNRVIRAIKDRGHYTVAVGGPRSGQIIAGTGMFAPSREEEYECTAHGRLGGFGECPKCGASSPARFVAMRASESELLP